MLLAFAAGGLIGLLLGFWFRVPALVAASVVAAAVILFTAPFQGFGAILTVAKTFAFLGVLQAGYFAGLVLSCVWTRAKLSAHNRSVLANNELLVQSRVRAR
jgi:hypothetical protein